MPLIFQHRIYRQDLKANPDILYVFGDNAQRVGLGGQAAEMRGEPNAVGIATKWVPTNDPAAFFSDDRFDLQRSLIESDAAPLFDALTLGRVVIWPLDGIGSGLSDVEARSPKTWAHLLDLQARLEGM